MQNLLVKPSGTDYFPSAARVYNATAAPQSDTINIDEILRRKGDAVSPSTFNGRVSLSFAGEQGSQTQFTLTPSPTLSARVVVVVEYTVSIGGTEEVFGVIVEYLPNKITDIKVEPADDTPSMGSYEQNGYTYYVYAPGDTVRFEATVEYANPRNSYMVEVDFRKKSYRIERSKL